MISKMKGALYGKYCKGKICNREAIAKALESGQLSGAGDVWFYNQLQMIMYGEVCRLV